MKISARRVKGEAAGGAVEVDYNFGGNLEEMTKLFGADIVFNHARGSLVVALQGWLRSQVDQKKSPAEIQKAVATWKPGQRRQGKSPQERLRDQVNKMSPEERAALLRELGAGVKK